MNDKRIHQLPSSFLQFFTVSMSSSSSSMATIMGSVPIHLNILSTRVHVLSKTREPKGILVYCIYLHQLMKRWAENPLREGSLFPSVTLTDNSESVICRANTNDWGNRKIKQIVYWIRGKPFHLEAIISLNFLSSYIYRTSLRVN